MKLKIGYHCVFIAKHFLASIAIHLEIFIAVM